VFCCTNKRPAGDERGCCVDRGGGELRNYLKERCAELNISDVRINAAGCLDRCAEGPVVVIYPEGVWYSPRTREDVEEIIQKHILGGVPVERIRI
jgi:(2Fe-2S) ferredoxin